MKNLLNLETLAFGVGAGLILGTVTQLSYANSGSTDEMVRMTPSIFIQNAISGAGNGGDELRAEFSAAANDGLAAVLKIKPDALTQAEQAAVRGSFASTKVYGVNFKLCVDDNDARCPSEEGFIAKNYPEQNIILVNTLKWGAANLLVRRSNALHEHLGIIGVERGNSAISSLLMKVQDKSQTSELRKLPRCKVDVSMDKLFRPSGSEREEKATLIRYHGDSVRMNISERSQCSSLAIELYDTFRQQIIPAIRSDVYQFTRLLAYAKDVEVSLSDVSRDGFYTQAYELKKVEDLTQSYGVQLLNPLVLHVCRSESDSAKYSVHAVRDTQTRFHEGVEFGTEVSGALGAGVSDSSGNTRVEANYKLTCFPSEE